MMIGYAISMAPLIEALPQWALFSSPLAQRAEDAAGVLEDLTATDPELFPLEENFPVVEANTGQAPEYRYNALESPSSIRLLEIRGRRNARGNEYTMNRGGESCSSVSCRIVHRDLNNSPDYETISYTWAGLPKRIPLFFDQEGFVLVNAPIYACLQRLEIGISPRYLWIDQICIDQNNTNERNIQVLLMKKIFQSAQKTLIWLGEEDEDTTLALECISKVPTMPRAPMFSREVPDTTLTIVKGMLGQGIKEPGSPAYKRRVAVGRLLNRGWFERAWVYQEAAVASSAVVQIGQHRVDFTQFCTAVRAFCDVERETWRNYGRSLTVATRGYNTLEAVEYGRRLLAEVHKDIEDDEMTKGAGKEDSRTTEGNIKADTKFLGLMFRLAGLVKATDLRDLVFAFLGFEDLNHPIIKPDYSLSVPQAYTRAALSFIEAAGDLDIFGTTSASVTIPGLPSWAPDWTQRWPQGVPLYRPDVASSFRACNDFTHKRKSSSDKSKYLVVRGKVIDTVALVSKHDFDLNDRNKGGLDVFLKLHQHLDYLRTARPPRVALKDKLGGIIYAKSGPDDSLLREPFVDMLEDKALQQKRLIKAILADNAYKFYPTEEDKTGQVPISASELEDYHKAFMQEDPIRQKNSWLAGLDHLTSVRDELRGNMLVSVKRRLFHGEYAHLGLAPRAVEVGDLVCILHGSRVPCVLRRVAEGERYELIGQCYYEDWMYGDQVNWAEEDADTFELQ